MDSSDECFGIVHGEGINLRAVRFAKTRTPKVQGWVLMDRPVSVSKLEGTLQDADVVVCFFSPAMAVCDGYQPRVSDLRENKATEVRAPNAIEYLSIRPDRCCRHVVPTKSRLAVRQVGIEDVTAQSSTRRAAQATQEAIVGELFFERECAHVDLMFDCF
jgi:hypothetical protein